MEARPAPRPTFRIGDIEGAVLSGGDYWLDAGTMFGIIPKVIWEKLVQPDARNRARLATRCLLVRTAGRRILIETGCGGKWAPRERSWHDFEEGEPIVHALAREGLEPGDIDAIVLTHLHFDHAGGLTRLVRGRPVPVFPRAFVYVQRGEFEDAVTNVATMRRSYLPENFLPIQDAGLLRLVEGDVDVVPGVRTMVTGGHTRRHQAVLLVSGPNVGIFPGDIVPTRHHARPSVQVAYDLFPYDTMNRKQEIFRIARDRRWIVFLAHDPDVASGTVRLDERGSFEIEPIGVKRPRHRR
ncbi:MAG: MBL fold metallo-hydrolase [Planctomycetota bacterium]